VKTTCKDMPFQLNGYGGVLQVIYEENRSTHRSGFDLFERLGFDSQRCIGYPTMRAFVKNYGGTGYYTISAWIQIITSLRYASQDGEDAAEVVSEIDRCETMAACGVPFFAHGYPAAIYDAPCDNLRGSSRLEWIADTFFVTYPSRINDDCIAYLAGFRWGYDEWDDTDGQRRVSIRPLQKTNRSVWQHFVPVMEQHCPRWTFQR